MGKDIREYENPCALNLLRALKRHLRFYPIPGTQRFVDLTKVQQTKALAHFAEDYVRTLELECRFLGISIKD